METQIKGTSTSLIRKWIQIILRKIEKKKLYEFVDREDIYMADETIAMLEILRKVFDPKQLETPIGYKIPKSLKKDSENDVKNYLMVIHKIII